MNFPRGTELIVLVILLILVFGWKRLPDAARSLGRSARVFKSEVEEMRKDGQADGTDGPVQSQAADEQGGARAPQQVTPPAQTPYQPQQFGQQTPDPHGQQASPAAEQPQYQQPPQRPEPGTPDDPTRPVA